MRRVSMKLAEFSAMNGHIARSGKSQTNLVSSNGDNGHSNVITDDDFLTNLAAEYKHYLLLGILMFGSSEVFTRMSASFLAGVIG